MLIDPALHPEALRRKVLRLAHEAYSRGGAYFVTVCTAERRCVLGSIKGGTVILTPVGEIVRDAWRALPDRFSSLELLQFVVMPNHVHGLLSIAGAVLAPPGVSTSAMLTGSQGGGVSLFGIMRAFKSISARQVNQTLRTNGRALWQRGCYEHVVRDGEDFGNVQRYILENPAKWELDQENPRIQIRSTGMDG